MPTTERLVTLEDICPSTGISAVRPTGVQTSAQLEILLSLDSSVPSRPPPDDGRLPAVTHLSDGRNGV
jgi:hypothetical protein